MDDVEEGHTMQTKQAMLEVFLMSALLDGQWLDIGALAGVLEWFLSYEPAFGPRIKTQLSEVQFPTLVVRL